MKPIIAAHFINDNNELLILKRAPDKKVYPNKWDVVAGKIEDGEMPIKALHREVEEEIGINNFIILEEKEEQYTFAELSYHVHLYLCKILEEKIILNKEHTEWKWVTLEQLKKEPLCNKLSEPFKKDLELFTKQQKKYF